MYIHNAKNSINKDLQEIYKLKNKPFLSYEHCKSLKNKNIDVFFEQNNIKNDEDLYAHTVTNRINEINEHIEKTLSKLNSENREIVEAWLLMNKLKNM